MKESHLTDVRDLDAKNCRIPNQAFHKKLYNQTKPDSPVLYIRIELNKFLQGVHLFRRGTSILAVQI